MMEEALIAHAKAVSVRLEVVPHSKESSVQGYDEWRKRIRVSLKQRPQGGAANRELVELMSDLFGVERGAVRITEGDHSRRKTIMVEGIAIETALEVLMQALE
ncbi:MAG: DUF167 domain-containing protein [Thermoplasmata archaeon]